MRLRGPNNFGRAVQTDPTLLRYASAIKKQQKCWELLAQNLTSFNINTTCDIQQCCVRLHGA